MGVGALAVAFVAALPVWFFDELEALEDVVGDGGPPALIAIAGLFAIAWVVGGCALALWSPSPAREGLWAGAVVAAVVAVRLIPAFLEFGAFILLPLVLFGAMAVGAGAVTGASAQRAQAGQPIPRAVALTAMAGGVVFFLASQVFAPGPEIFTSPLGIAILVVAGLLVGGGAWALRPRRAGAGPRT